MVSTNQMTEMTQMTHTMQNEKGDTQKQKFKRTEICKFYEAGACTRGSSCNFAHGNDSLRSKPDFAKTRLCNAFMKTGSCAKGSFCNFSHGKDEQQMETRKPAQADSMSKRGKAIQAQGNKMPKPLDTVIPAQQLGSQPPYQLYYAVPLLAFSDWQQLMAGDHEKDKHIERSSDAGVSTDADSNTPPFSKQPSQVSNNVSQPAASPPSSWQEVGVSIKNTFIEVDAVHASNQRLQRCISAPNMF